MFPAATKNQPTTSPPSDEPETKISELKVLTSASHVTHGSILKKELVQQNLLVECILLFSMLQIYPLCNPIIKKVII